MSTTTHPRTGTLVVLCGPKEQMDYPHIVGNILRIGALNTVPPPSFHALFVGGHREGWRSTSGILCTQFTETDDRRAVHSEQALVYETTLEGQIRHAAWWLRENSRDTLPVLLVCDMAQEHTVRVLANEYLASTFVQVHGIMMNPDRYSDFSGFADRFITAPLLTAHLALREPVNEALAYVRRRLRRR